jgi:peptidyl-tRNA hydrolase
MDSADFVLSRFRSAEEGDLDKGMSDAEKAVCVVRDEGIDAAMNRFNPAAA